MPYHAILHEAQQLMNACKRLELLAEQNAPLAEPLLTICGTIGSTATLLEVLVVTKLDGQRPI
jgi:hypothetical protein